MSQKLIEKAKQLFLKRIADHGEDPWELSIHVQEAEKWANKILNKYTEDNKDVIMLSLWLHDIGHYPIPVEDHAIVSETIAKKFFIEENVDRELVNKVLHCVRSHRNRDIKPNSMEAKLFAMIDSVSHFTYIPYIKMAQDGRLDDAIQKLERDYRDIKSFPDIEEEIRPLYLAFKNLLLELNKVQLKLEKNANKQTRNR